jgi:hypothetical protein
MQMMIADFTENEQVRALLSNYLVVRRKRGLIPQQWKVILDDLRDYCKDDGDLAMEMIQGAIANGSGSIIMQWHKDRRNKVNHGSFDTAADNHRKKGVALMSDEEKKKFEEELAVNEDGELMQF